MDSGITVSPAQLGNFLLNVALVRPVFIWGPPGIGKSALVQQFADEVDLPCVSLLGSQLAPEDIIGVPQIIDGKSRFCPPGMIARDEPYCLFLDELNACSHEVQKAFYSLIHERRIGDYHLPPGSIVIGAGNRAQDNAIVRPMSSALMNRLVHVHLKASARDWLAWAYEQEIHSMVTSYIEARPDHLWVQPPKTEEPFSTPRSWHMLSDALYAYGDGVTDTDIEMLAFGCLTPAHAVQFIAFIKQVRSQYQLEAILEGKVGWPREPKDVDILYFLAQSFRALLIKELPVEEKGQTERQKLLAYRAKARLKELASFNLEVAKMAVARTDADHTLPGWFMIEIVRDLPRLAERDKEKDKKHA